MEPSPPRAYQSELAAVHTPPLDLHAHSALPRAVETAATLSAMSNQNEQLSIDVLGWNAVVELRADLRGLAAQLVSVMSTMSARCAAIEERLGECCGSVEARLGGELRRVDAEAKQAVAELDRRLHTNANAVTQLARGLERRVAGLEEAAQRRLEPPQPPPHAQPPPPPPIDEDALEERMMAAAAAASERAARVGEDRLRGELAELVAAQLRAALADARAEAARVEGKLGEEAARSAERDERIAEEVASLAADVQRTAAAACGLERRLAQSAREREAHEEALKEACAVLERQVREHCDALKEYAEGWARDAARRAARAELESREGVVDSEVRRLEALIEGLSGRCDRLREAVAGYREELDAGVARAASLASEAQRGIRELRENARGTAMAHDRVDTLQASLSALRAESSARHTALTEAVEGLAAALEGERETTRVLKILASKKLLGSESAERAKVLAGLLKAVKLQKGDAPQAAATCDPGAEKAEKEGAKEARAAPAPAPAPPAGTERGRYGARSLAEAAAALAARAAAVASNSAALAPAPAPAPTAAVSALSGSASFSTPSPRAKRPSSVPRAIAAAAAFPAAPPTVAGPPRALGRT
eukprot:tig00020904_g15257.t1